MILEVKNWQEECEVRALKFAQDTMNGFQDSLQSCVPRLPKVERDGKIVRNQNDKDLLLNIFLDVLLGATANIAATYCNDLSSQFEDRMVHEFRRKFFVARKRSIQGEQVIADEMAKLAIQKLEEPKIN